MMRTKLRWAGAALLMASMGLLPGAWAQGRPAPARPPGPPPGQAQPGQAQQGDIKRGEYLVTLGGCNDCHTPYKMGQKGPEPDMTRMLSGHPEKLVMPAPPRVQSPWGAVASESFTAWAGPWGVSYTANLTPDNDTGLGKWTLQEFTQALRTGRHMGRGREILPPMPWQGIGKMTDADLIAVYGYLRSIPPIKNLVPNPKPPEAVGRKPPPKR